jgi:hypothetical protein
LGALISATEPATSINPAAYRPTAKTVAGIRIFISPKKSKLLLQPAGAGDNPLETGNSAEATEQERQSIRLSKLIQLKPDHKIFYYLGVGIPGSATGKSLRQQIGAKYRTWMGEMPLPVALRASTLFVLRTGSGGRGVLSTGVVRTGRWVRRECETNPTG